MKRIKRSTIYTGLMLTIVVGLIVGSSFSVNGQTNTKPKCAEFIVEFKDTIKERGGLYSGQMMGDEKTRRYMHGVAQMIKVPTTFFSTKEYVGIFFGSKKDSDNTLVMTLDETCNYELMWVNDDLHTELITKIIGKQL